MEKLKKSFFAGLLVLIPLWLSTAVIGWLFGWIDNLFVPVIEGVIKMFFPGMPHIPGLGVLSGLLIILALGVLVRNVVGKRIIEIIERLIYRIPGYRQIYSTVKQVTNAFSSENKASFNEVVLVEHPREGVYVVAFHTTTVEYNGRKYAVVYFATNHMYLGDVFLFPDEKVVRLDMPADEAIRFLLSAGIACPKTLHTLPRREMDASVEPDA